MSKFDSRRHCRFASMRKRRAFGPRRPHYTYLTYGPLGRKPITRKEFGDGSYVFFVHSDPLPDLIGDAMRQANEITGVAKHHFGTDPEMDRVMRGAIYAQGSLYEDQPINAGRKERAEAWDRAVYDILRRKADM